MSVSVSAEFVQLVRKGLARAGNKQNALAKVVGLSEQRISDVLRSKGYPFGVLNCLRLARLIDEQDWVVLRAANKGPLADLLEERYGRTTPTPIQGRSLRQLEKLDADDLTHLMTLAKRLARRDPPRRR